MSRKLTRHPGGKGANQASAAAKTGLEVYLAGKIGEDGRWMLDILRENGVDTRYVAVGDQPTGHCVIQVDDAGQNSIVFYPGANMAVTPGERKSVLGSFSPGNVLLIQNEINDIPDLITEAKNAGLKVWFNAAPFLPPIHDYPLETLDLLLINEGEGADLAGGIEDPGAIVACLTARLPDTEILLTLGPEGVRWGRGDERSRASVIDVPVADTTGAGDTFIGFYLAALTRNLDVQERLEWACAASSLAVSRHGSLEAVPTWDEVADFRATHLPG